MIDTNGLSTKEQEAFFKVKHKCELCLVEMPEETLQSYDGYKDVCVECIESSEGEKKEESDYLNGLRAGRTEMALDILHQLDGDQFADSRKIVLETISRLQA